jgi:hypothetical protein
MGANNQRDDDEAEAFFREWTIPEEDLPPCITTKRKPGEHRWFRSPNVICLEKYRRLKALGRI